jgi:hypothetical protein
MIKLVNLFVTALLALPCVAKNKQEVVQLTRENTVVLSGDIDPVSFDTFTAAIVGKRLRYPVEFPLYVVVVSSGGKYKIAVAEHVFLGEVPNVSLLCKWCGSAAGYLFATAQYPRLVIEKSIMQMHELFIPNFTARDALNSKEMETLFVDSDEFNKGIYSVMGMAKVDYEKRISNTVWTVYGPEMVERHLADKMVKITCDAYITALLPDTCAE